MSGEAAFRTPDLIIADLGLPDTDGVDVIRKLRTWTEQPLIVLPGHKPELDPTQRVHILTETGVGYRLFGAQ